MLRSSNEIASLSLCVCLSVCVSLSLSLSLSLSTHTQTIIVEGRPRKKPDRIGDGGGYVRYERFLIYQGVCANNVALRGGINYTDHLMCKVKNKRTSDITPYYPNI